MNDFKDLESPVIEWKPIEVPDQDKEIKIGDPLPVEYQGVLRNLKPDIPNEFKNRARLAAYYFYALENGRKIVDQEGKPLDKEVERLAEQLTTSNYILTTYVAAKTYKKGALDPKEALPKWIPNRVEQADETLLVELSAEEKKKLEDFHASYAQKNGIFDGTYAYYNKKNSPNREISESLVNNFKYYIEGVSAKNIGKIEEVLNELDLQKIHPHSSKVFESVRLVLYWHSQPEGLLTEKITSVFEKEGIKMRGPAQDPVQVVVKEGRYEMQIRTSNDGSLGEGGHNPFVWQEDLYDQSKFFEQYLRLTFHGAKDPANPYLINFVPIVIENIEENKELIKEIEEKIRTRDNLPTYTTDGRHLEVLK